MQACRVVVHVLTAAEAFDCQPNRSRCSSGRGEWFLAGSPQWQSVHRPVNTADDGHSRHSRPVDRQAISEVRGLSA
jgi:hypothetical protein